jgi:hypothetical protein
VCLVLAVTYFVWASVLASSGGGAVWITTIAGVANGVGALLTGYAAVRLRRSERRRAEEEREKEERGEEEREEQRP